MITEQKDLILALKEMVPLCELRPEQLSEVMRDMIVETLPAGKTLFHKGETSDKSIYLIEGELLCDDGKTKLPVQAGTTASRFALAPHDYTAVAATEIQIVLLDKNLLDILLTWDQTAGVMVEETSSLSAEEDSDWMLNVLASPIFHKIPPANIQIMFSRMDEIRVKKDQLIISQGGEPDYYYSIKKGRCAVSRWKDDKEHVISELGVGQGFGEDALITDSIRNASVRMLTDGVLMRLSREDFESLLKEPILQMVNYDDADDLVADAGAQWLDVRLNIEYLRDSIPDSMNIPLNKLRANLHKLSSAKKYIVYCDTGRRSESAAFILNEHGLDAIVLEDGLEGL